MKVKMKVKKFLALLLACACIASALSGCGDSGSTATTTKSPETTTSSGEKTEEATDSASTEEVKEPFDPRSITEGVTLTVAAVGKATLADYENMFVTKKVEEALGVNLEFMEIPSADYHQKLNVMVSGGEDLPDIVLYPYENYTYWAEEGAIIPLNKYYENPDYSANLRKFMEENDVDFIKDFKDSKGYIYKFPISQGTVIEKEYGRSGQKIWIYEPWLEALGKEMPTTWDEFFEICKLVKETDLNGNGKHDEIPLTGWGFALGENVNNGWFDLMMNGYVYSSGIEMAYVEDGRVGLAYAADEFKEGLKYIKTWFDAGLIPKETVANDANAGKALLQAEEQIVFAFTNTTAANVTNLERRSGYTPIVALEAPTGKTVSYYRMDTLTCNSAGGPVISAGCKNPDAAFLVLDYFCSEEISMINYYGEEGVHWDYWENAKVDNKANYKAAYEGYDISLIQYSTYTVAGQTTGYSNYICRLIPERIQGGVAVSTVEPATDEEKWTSVCDQKMREVRSEFIKYAPEEVIHALPLSNDEQSEVADVISTLNTYVPEMVSAFLTGGKNIDADWDAYKAELEKIGIEKLQEVYQNVYNRVK